MTVSGTYPTGTAGILRRWDGHAWDSSVIASPGTAGFSRPDRWSWLLRERGLWVALAGLVVGGVLASTALGNAEGARAVRFVAGLVAVGSAQVGIVLMARRRLRLNQVRLVVPVALGVPSGLIAVVVASFVEQRLLAVLLPDGLVFVQLGLVAGGVEETAKLALPVLLWVAGPRWLRDPRSGLLLGLSSGATFALIEGAGYIASGHGLQGPRASSPPGLADVLVDVALRWSGEVLHPLLTGSVAAAVWLAAWRGHGLLSRMGLAAYGLAVLAHGVNDGLGSAANAVVPGALYVFDTAMVVIIYLLLFRRRGRELAPPDALAGNPDPWRPKVPTPAGHNDNDVTADEHK